MSCCPRGPSHGNCPPCCHECEAGTWSWAGPRNTPNPQVWRPPPPGSLPRVCRLLCLSMCSLFIWLSRLHPTPNLWSWPASPGQGAQRSASGLPTAAEWFSKRTARTECLQRQSGEPGPRAFQDTLSPGWVTSARLGVSGVQHERLVHVVGQVPPGSWLTACDRRLSPELAWESSSTVEGSQRQHYEHLQAHSLKSAVTR